jgi:hypothetical protein
MLILLLRISSNDNGTFGVLCINNRPYYVTLELPWKNNTPNISCVPPGTYKATKMFSEKFKKTVYVLHNVPGRDLIEIHIGNKIEQTLGCILLGSEFSKTDYAIVDSRVAFDDFMIRVPEEGFTITISDVILKEGASWI